VGLAVAALVAILVVAPAASADPTSLVSKRAEAQRVLGQIQSLDSTLSHAIEAYNLANERLGAIQADLRETERELVIARANLKRAEKLLSRRLTALYTSGGGGSALDVVLGAQSLGELLDGIETASRVSNQDASVLQGVQRFRATVQSRKLRLKHARAAQTRLVAEKAAHKASIESQLGERQRLLSSIRGEIERIQAAERERQAELERQARARLLQAQSEPELVTDPLGAVTDGGSELIAAAPPSRYGGVVGIAMQYLGIAYVYGGSTPAGFDCSGFVMYVYAQVGISLPHNAAAQYAYGSPVSRSQLEPGDLVFFNGLGHNGIYIGGGQFIHSPHTGDVVKISSLSGWYDSTWVGARRL
jgi:peptidoglycan DL-endopeptidase CwlO